MHSCQKHFFSAYYLLPIYPILPCFTSNFFFSHFMEFQKAGKMTPKYLKGHVMIIKYLNCLFWLPEWLSGKESMCQCRRCWFDPWIRNIPWRRKWLPPPVFLPGKAHGQRSLAGYSWWSRKRAGHKLASKQLSILWILFASFSLGSW